MALEELVYHDYVSHRYYKTLTSNLFKTGNSRMSIRSPIFLIYINDLPNSARFAKFCFYADDNTIITSPNSIDQFPYIIFNIYK